MRSITLKQLLIATAGLALAFAVMTMALRQNYWAIGIFASFLFAAVALLLSGGVYWLWYAVGWVSSTRFRNGKLKTPSALTTPPRPMEYME